VYWSGDLMEREIGRERLGVRPMPTLNAQRTRVEDGAPGLVGRFASAVARMRRPPNFCGGTNAGVLRRWLRMTTKNKQQQNLQRRLSIPEDDE
jgi:hypothetical protein